MNNLAAGRCFSWCQRSGYRVLLSRRVPYSTSADTPPFQRAKRGPFFQEPPVLYNPFVEDSALRSFLKRTLPEEVTLFKIGIIKSSYSGSSNGRLQLGPTNFSVQFYCYREPILEYCAVYLECPFNPLYVFMLQAQSYLCVDVFYLFKT